MVRRRNIDIAIGGLLSGDNLVVATEGILGTGLDTDITVDGSAPINLSLQITPTGQITVDGSAPINLTSIIIPTGQITVDGTAPITPVYNFGAFDGQITVDGAAVINLTSVIIPTGQITVDGTAPMSAGYNLGAFDGQIDVDGTAPQNITINILPLGIITVDGTALFTASFIMPTAGGMVTDGSGTPLFTINILPQGVITVDGSAIIDFIPNPFIPQGRSFGYWDNIMDFRPVWDEEEKKEPVVHINTSVREGGVAFSGSSPMEFVDGFLKGVTLTEDHTSFDFDEEVPALRIKPKPRRQVLEELYGIDNREQPPQQTAVSYLYGRQQDKKIHPVKTFPVTMKAIQRKASLLTSPEARQIFYDLQWNKMLTQREKELKFIDLVHNAHRVSAAYNINVMSAFKDLIDIIDIKDVYVLFKDVNNIDIPSRNKYQLYLRRIMR